MPQYLLLASPSVFKLQLLLCALMTIVAGLGSERTSAAQSTKVGYGPFLTVMAEGSGPIAALRTFRREGR